MTAERRPAAELRLSKPGFDVLADREGLELEAYLDERGILTIGIGHTSAAGPPKVTQGMTITRDEAQEIFVQDAERFRRECQSAAGVPVHQHELDALASFLFNIGSTNFLGSTALKRLKQGDYAGCAEAMSWWNKPPSLISRRRGEIEQFLHGRYVARIDR
jgi:lysozyme